MLRGSGIDPRSVLTDGECDILSIRCGASEPGSCPGLGTGDSRGDPNAATAGSGSV